LQLAAFHEVHATEAAAACAGYRLRYQQQGPLHKAATADRTWSKLAMDTMVARWSGPTSYPRIRCPSVYDVMLGVKDPPDGAGSSRMATE
jgi:hypothetical protein